MQILSTLLKLSTGTVFHSRNATALIQLALRLIREAAKHEQVDRWTRRECLECADAISGALNLSDQQLGFLLEQLFAASTWKHGIRSPECLAQAMVAIGHCVTKFSGPMSEDALNTVLQKCCCNLESDYLQIRLESVALSRTLLAHLKAHGLTEFRLQDLAFNLVQRLDDAKTQVTLQALAAFEELLELK